MLVAIRECNALDLINMIHVAVVDGPTSISPSQRLYTLALGLGLLIVSISAPAWLGQSLA